MNKHDHELEEAIDDFSPVVMGRSHLRVSLIAVFAGIIAVAASLGGGLVILNTKIDQSNAETRAQQARQSELLRALIETKADKSAAKDRYTNAQADIQNAANAQRFTQLEKSIDQRFDLIIKMTDRTQRDVRELRKH
jgi:Tfp pilus assembly protein PilN